MNGEAGFGEDFVGAGLLEMQTTRSVRLIAVMPSRASPLPHWFVAYTSKDCSNNHQLPCTSLVPSLQLRPLL